MAFNNLLSFVGDIPDINVNNNNPFWQALNRAPKLTMVELRRLWPLNSIPYPQITTLTIGFVGVNEVVGLLQVLEASINLRSLELGFVVRVPNPTPHIIVPPYAH
ncbi:hypothetical protein E1B28_003536 [Marasmius oreades]|uniref:Uncharacterized protein n=1 Tax=Marasmius oreades TaxID=181124 RepID=A0A9P7UNI5_9AGAR|nr:uncharacterized protein E1B28_003536 [Marasmius oreades]KAG7086014.1 hypothetical protein E1B28_003536 [Marasmius oreades]